MGQKVVKLMVSACLQCLLGSCPWRQVGSDLYLLGAPETWQFDQKERFVVCKTKGERSGQPSRNQCTDRDSAFVLR